MMATYFNGGSEIQADNLQTLYLMNRGGYAGAYSSDASQPTPGVLFLNNAAANNSASALAHQGSIHHHHHHQHHLVGIPLAGDDPGRPSVHEISSVGSAAAALHGQLVPRFHYNLWGGGGGDPSPSGGHQIPTAIAMSGGGGELGSPMGFRRPAPVTIAATSSTSSLEHHHHQHHHQQGGLSLSLNNSSPHKNAAARPMALAVLSPGSGTPTSGSGVSHGGAPSMIAGSKFLKAAQQLLDEVVNVGKAIDSKSDGISAKDKAKAAVVGTGDGTTGGGESGGAKGSAAELTTAQRQELQMKKAKLLNMLDEVEQRYRQYHSQMQMVAASFEQAAGEGSAKSYTALALQTISKQFRCLKDAIASQIKATRKSMGEEEEDDEGGEGKARSRLRMVDHQLRQQRALQQLGMMHHNAWRPQRGLPERAVSVLRAWLFEHFLHPYPKDSDKHMLAKQTGLTRSQVSNWFINARVRLWKPMVEEMYVEEMKSQEQNGSDNNHAATTNNNTNDHNNDAASPKSLHSRQGHNHSFNQNPQELLAPNDVVSNPGMTTMISPSSSNGPLQGFSLSEMDPMMAHRSPKRQRMMINSDVIPTTTILTTMDKMEMKPGGRDLFPPDLTGFGSYPMGEIGSRFNPEQHQYHQGNTVSLTLGLPHDCDQSLSLSASHQQSYFPGHGGQAVQLPAAGGGYQEMNDVQSRKRFAAQLLPDYVT